MADPSETTQVSLGPSEPETAELLGAVRALSAQVGGLQTELQTIRAQQNALPASSADPPGWGSAAAPARRETSTWMRSLEGPGPRPPAVPRLLLEVVFLIAVAGAAAIAELDPVVIGVLMAAAWILVAVTEWLAAQAARRHAEVSQMPLAGAGASAYFADDPSWFAPPVERTVLEIVEDPGDEIEDTQDGIDEDTAAPTTRLPPRAED
jgi:hypothetical protein